ncbi:MAG: FIST C-terminal domain-containing protein [Oscillospiraceae bacterium]|nr:FIST C-terminal domain-containing protein [Oscillospiraceae bacterium]
MIKTITLHTTELDYEDKAVGELLAQLEQGGGLLKNTVGIISCHYEFVLSDIFKAACEALPFEIVGTITSAQSVPGEIDTLLMTIMVLTSDDVEFDTIVTDPLMSGNPGQVISDNYKSSCRAEKPALILTFAPFIAQNCGDEYVNAVTEASGGAPCFGTLAIDDTLDFVNCFMLADKEHHNDKMAMILIYGAVSPKFYVANISESRIFGKGANITKSAGSLLMELNGRHVKEYFDEISMTDAAEQQYAMSSLPFLVDFNDGSPKVSRIFVMFVDGGYALCAAAMPQGGTMYIAKTDGADVLLTAGNAIDEITEDIAGKSALLVYTCISRAMALGGNQLGELELLDKKIGGKIPFMVGNSGGEICPTMVSGEKAINRFHNNAFVACMF